MNIDIQSEESDIQSEESVLPKDGVVYSAIVYSRGSTRLASCKRCGLWTLRYPEAGKKLSLLWLTLGWSHLHAHDASVSTWPLTTHHVLCLMQIHTISFLLTWWHDHTSCSVLWSRTLVHTHPIQASNIRLLRLQPWLLQIYLWYAQSKLDCVKIGISTICSLKRPRYDRLDRWLMT